jgi:hypothetical protein
VRDLVELAGDADYLGAVGGDEHLHGSHEILLVHVDDGDERV